MRAMKDPTVLGPPWSFRDLYVHLQAAKSSPPAAWYGNVHEAASAARAICSLLCDDHQRASINRDKPDDEDPEPVLSDYHRGGLHRAATLLVDEVVMNLEVMQRFAPRKP